MREIRKVIFRGKRTDNVEWIEGSLLGIDWCDKPSTYSIAPNTPVSVFYSVILETVGKYTGLTDNNGRKIFEGDIVNYISSDVIGNPKTGTIIVDDMTDYDTMIYLNHSGEVEVIGNIHDNPELLENSSL